LPVEVEVNSDQSSVNSDQSSAPLLLMTDHWSLITLPLGLHVGQLQNSAIARVNGSHAVATMDGPSVGQPKLRLARAQYSGASGPLSQGPVIRRDKETGKIVERVWRDTVLVTPKEPVTIRVRYLDFPGKTIFHCHNLAHEDLGMMANIEVVRTPAELTQPDRLVLPWRPPDWKLTDAAGQWHRAADFKGGPVPLVFYQGGTCPHCLQQLKMLRDYAGTPAASALQIVTVSPEPRAALAPTQKWLGGDRILLLADETTELFRQFHCLAGDAPRHGLFLLNPEGQVVWYRVSAEALTDITPLRLAFELQTKR
jgi:peroxiredoxin